MYRISEEGHTDPRQTIACPLPPSPSPLLSIPKISPEVPGVFSEPCHPVFLEFGKLLVHHGIAISNDEDVCIRNLVENAFDGHMQTLFHFLDDDHIATVSDRDADGYSLADDASSLCLAFSLDLTSAPSFMVRDKMNEIRKRNPPLAWYAWSVLQRVSHIIPVLTPDWFMEIVSYTQWMGEPDESFYIDEMVMEGIEEADISVITYAEVMKVIAPWSLSACRSKPEKIRRHIQPLRLAREDYQLLERLDALHASAVKIHGHPMHHQLESFAKEFAAVLFFDDANRGGLCWQVLDDLYRGNMEGGSDCYVFRMVFKPSEEPLLFEFLDDISRLWESLLQVLPLIGETT